MGLMCVIANEQRMGDTRVAMVPTVAEKLVKAGWHVVLETNAGMMAGFVDESYRAVGVDVVKDLKTTCADVLLAVNLPDGKAKLPLGDRGVLVTLTRGPQGWESLAKQAPNVLALEKLPRTSRAQALDVLSSQANLAGYAAALNAAAQFDGLLPPLSTAAGSAKPAKALVLGVGVAGLQAIATLRRLGAAVRAFDVRPEVQEQIVSLGAKPVVLEAEQGSLGQGGYAVALSAEAQVALAARLRIEIAMSDLVITTAQVPGKPAPLLVDAEAVAAMRCGSVLVDMGVTTNNVQGLSGGNCPMSRAGETVRTANGVKIVGETNFAARVGRQASIFWAQNMANLLTLCVKKDAWSWDDELISAMRVVKDGKVGD